MTEMVGEVYDAWNTKKKDLSQMNQGFFFKEGEIWWCSIGINLGTESLGKGDTFRRPVLILKKLSKDSCIVLPLTTQEKTGTWFKDVEFQGIKRWVMLYQIRMIHTKRFQRRMAVLEISEFISVKQKLEALLELSQNHHPLVAESVGNPKNMDTIAEEKMSGQGVIL